MTEDEQIRIMGQAVKDLADAREELACFKARADEYRALFSVAEQLLSGQPSTQSLEGLWPSLDEIRAVYTGIHRATEQINKIENRLKKWGV